MLFDMLYEQAMAGGWVLIPIFLTGAAGFYLLGWNVRRLGRDFLRYDYSEYMEKFEELLNQGQVEEAKSHLRSRRGMVPYSLLPGLEHDDWSDNQLRNYYTERLMRLMNNMDRGIHMATVLAGTAPLLGLLGTVTGMVNTFEIITLYGNSNPVLMADGISEALITTQSGLVIAFPLVLMIHRIEERIEWIKKQMEVGVTLILNSRHRIRKNGVYNGSL